MCKLEKIRFFFDQRWSESYEWKAIHTHCLRKGQLTCSPDNYLKTFLLNLTAELALKVFSSSANLPTSREKKYYYTTLLLKRTSDTQLPISKTSLSLALLICNLGDTKSKVIESTSGYSVLQKHYNLHMHSKKSFNILLISDLDQNRVSRAKYSHSKIWNTLKNSEYWLYLTDFV